MLLWLVDKLKIEPHIPVLFRSERPDGTFSNGEFVVDADEFTGPE